MPSPVPYASTIALQQRFSSVMRRLRAIGLEDVDSLSRKAEQAVNSARLMEEIIAKRFARQATRATAGTAWAQRKRAGDGHPILNLTGLLRRAALEQVQGTYKLDNRLIEWEVPDAPEYGEYHQEGTARMPRRQFVLRPSKNELVPANKLALEVIKRELNAILRRAR